MIGSKLGLLGTTKLSEPIQKMLAPFLHDRPERLSVNVAMDIRGYTFFDEGLLAEFARLG